VDAARALITFAQLRGEQGRLTEAEQFGLRALEIFEKADAKGVGVSRSLQWLGIIAWRAARHAEAETYLKRALAVSEGTLGPGHWEVGTALYRLGNVYAATGRFSEAEELYRRSLQNLEASVGTEHRSTILAMRALAVSQLNAGNIKEAEVVVRKAITAAEASLGPEHLDTAYLLRVLGSALVLQGQFAEAESAYARGLAVSERLYGEGARLIGFFSYALGDLYLAQGRLPEARSMLERALAGGERTLGPDHPNTLNSLRMLAELDLKSNRPEEALSKLKRVVAALGARRQEGGQLTAQRFSNEIRPLLRRSASASLANAAWQLGAGTSPSSAERADDAFVAAQLATQSTAAAAISQMAVRFASSDDALGRLVREGQDLVQRWQAIDQQLTAGAGQNAADAKARQELRAELDQVDKDLRAVDLRLAVEFPQFAALTQPRPLKIGEVQTLLDADEVVLAFLVAGNESFVWAISQERFSWQRLAIGRAVLGEKVARMRRGLDIVELQKKATSGKVDLFDLKLAHELYEQLIGPISHTLDGKRRVLVVPSGPLTSLPFHLLVTDPPARTIDALEHIPEYSGAGWVISRHAFTLLPSVSSLKALRELGKRPAGTKPLIGYGDPAFGLGKPVIDV
jgi:tetratricopeptide (TPR) repeat protein